MSDTPSLASLDGNPAPAAMCESIAALGRIPERAQAQIWDVLDAVIVVRDPEAAGQQVEAFGKLHDVPVALLDQGSSAVCFLLQAASARNLPVERFTEDLAALFGEPLPIQETLAAGYSSARQKIREEIKRQTLLDHGRLLTGLDWRIDTTEASHRGMELRYQLAVMTLQFQESGRHGVQRQTFYVTPEAVAELRRCCDAVLGAMQAGGSAAV